MQVTLLTPIRLPRHSISIMYDAMDVTFSRYQSTLTQRAMYAYSQAKKTSFMTHHAVMESE